MIVTFSKIINFGQYSHSSASISVTDDVLKIDVYKDSDVILPEDPKEIPTDGILPKVINDTPWGPKPLQLEASYVFEYSKAVNSALIQDRSTLLPGSTTENWKNLTVEGFLTKTTLKQFLLNYGINPSPSGVQNSAARFLLFVPLKTYQFSDYKLHILQHDPEYPVIINGNTIDPSNELVVEHKNVFFDDLQKNIFYHLKLLNDNSVNSGDTATVEVQLLDKDNNIVNKSTEVYIEATAGVLNKQRCVLTNGVGRFTVNTTGISSGELIRIKAGWKYWTGDVESTIIIN